MKTTKTLAAVAATFALGAGLIGCSSDSEPAPTKTPDLGSYFSEPEQQPVDPYASNGTWKIPEQIAPGRYHATPNNDPVVTMRWFQLCADPYCDQVMSETTEYVQAGGTYVLIPDDGTVKGIKNMGVKLEPVE
jgi:hypothetical protein